MAHRAFLALSVLMAGVAGSAGSAAAQYYRPLPPIAVEEDDVVQAPRGQSGVVYDRYGRPIEAYDRYGRPIEGLPQYQDNQTAANPPGGYYQDNGRGQGGYQQQQGGYQQPQGGYQQQGGYQPPGSYQQQGSQQLDPGYRPSPAYGDSGYRNGASQQPAESMRPPAVVYGNQSPAPGAPMGVAPQQQAPGSATGATVATLPPEDQPETEVKELPARFKRQMVDYVTKEPAGTLVIDTPNTYLYLVMGGGKAMRYGIGVGREGFTWTGVEKISRMAEWPDWHPPAEMIERQPYLPRFMAGGPGNPLGARAMYLGKTLYRIHGTNQPSTIGTFVSSGCVRLVNDDVEDLFSRVKVGARVVVLPGGSPATTAMNNAPVNLSASQGGAMTPLAEAQGAYTPIQAGGYQGGGYQGAGGGSYQGGSIQSSPLAPVRGR